jgi:hypothetical protein
VQYPPATPICQYFVSRQKLPGRRVFYLTNGGLSWLALTCATRDFLHLPTRVFALRAGSILLRERGVAGVVQAIMVKQGKVSGAADPRKEERARTE